MALTEQNRARCLVVCSAVLAAIAFLFPAYCAEVIFIFLAPLFYTILLHDYEITYKEGFLWGVIFYLLVFLDIYILIVHKGYGIARFVAIAFLAVYSAGISACWFSLSQFLCSLYPIKSNTLKIVCWGFVTFVYCIFIENSFFLIFGLHEGNSLLHFVLPLAVRSPWLYYIVLLGKNKFFLFVIMVNIFISVCCAYKRYSGIIGCSIFLLVLFCGMPWLQEKEGSKHWHEQIGCTVVQTSKSDPVCAAEKIMNALHVFQEKFPQCRYIIMPESTFAFPLNQLKKYISLWECPSKIVFLGAHRYEGNCLYNTLYYINDESIFDYYDKNHRMFFTEKIPIIWSLIPGVRTLFLSDKLPFTEGKSKNNFIIPNIGNVKPLICSDLFFAWQSLPMHKIYMCIVNDSWFFSSYISNLMFLHAKVVAALKKSSIIYCAYRHCAIITAQGNCIYLPTFIA